ncbi:MAG: hypothetical protein WA631_10860 [Nitrososphaeraceae archaeon]
MIRSIRSNESHEEIKPENPNSKPISDAIAFSITLTYRMPQGLIIFLIFIMNT